MVEVMCRGDESTRKKMDASVLLIISFGEIWSSPKSLIVDTVGLMALLKLHQRGHVCLGIQHPTTPLWDVWNFFSDILVSLSRNVIRSDF